MSSDDQSIHDDTPASQDVSEETRALSLPELRVQISSFATELYLLGFVAMIRASGTIMLGVIWGAGPAKQLSTSKALKDAGMLNSATMPFIGAYACAVLFVWLVVVPVKALRAMRTAFAALNAIDTEADDDRLVHERRLQKYAVFHSKCALPF